MLLVNKFDSDLHVRVLMLCQNHFAEAAFAKQTKLMALSTKVLDALPIPDPFQAFKQGLITLEEYVVMSFVILDVKDKGFNRRYCIVKFDILDMASKCI